MSADQRGEPLLGTRFPARYTKQQRQEDRSRGQLKDRFAEYGWATNFLVDRDLGEDLEVQIYRDGRSRGTDFYIQLKSTTNLAKRRLARDPGKITYTAETRDLLHWEQRTRLVILMLWDVHKRRGIWQSIGALIADLDDRLPGWRKRKTATLHLPARHTTSDAGLSNLAKQVARHALRALEAERKAKVLLRIDRTTEEGRRQAALLQRVIDYGEEATLGGPSVSLRGPPQWHDALGVTDDGSELELRFGPPEDRNPVAVTLRAVSSRGMTTLDTILKATQVGRRLHVLSNHHAVADGDGVRCKITIALPKSEEDAELQLELPWLCPRVGPTAASLEFRDILLEGGRLQVLDRDSGDVLIPAMDVPPLQDDPDELRHRIRVAKAIQILEAHEANSGQFKLPKRIGRERVYNILIVSGVLAGEAPTRKMTVRHRFGRAFATDLLRKVQTEASGQGLQLTLQVPPQELPMFGGTVLVPEVDQTISMPTKQLERELSRKLEEVGEDPVEIRFRSVWVTWKQRASDAATNLPSAGG